MARDRFAKAIELNSILGSKYVVMASAGKVAGLDGCKIVAERLGHSTVTQTLDTYSHVLPDMQERSATRLEQALFGTP